MKHRINNTWQQKRKFSLFLLMVTTLFFIPKQALAQVVGGGNVEAGFGVDGDVASDTALFGSAASTSTKGHSSDDWFKYKAGSGIGVIDTTGAAAIRSILQANVLNRQNYVFSRGMSVPKLTRSGGYILLDALYSKDYFNQDSTAVISSGSKASDDPTTWTMGLGTVGGKEDIMEFYSHVRRKGASVKDSLFFYFAVAMHDPSGNKNVTAELFVNDVRLNRATGKLNSPGPDGGRLSWRFDALGNVIQIGDMSVAISYNPGSGSFSIEPRLWVSDSFLSGGLKAVNPVNFDWGTKFDIMTGGGTFGWADITPNGGSGFFAQGSANGTDTTLAGPWGTITSASSHDWSRHYDANQLIEVSINFTALGVDPSTFTALDPCSVPYRSLVFRSRSAASFNASIVDFAGPYPFWRYPRVPGNIKGQDTLTCSYKTGSVYADSAYSLAWYKWTTVGGHISNYNSDSTIMYYNAPGLYVLETAPIRGCWTQKDSITILQDILKPVATAYAYDSLVQGSTFQVKLYGGDSAASITAVNSPYFGSSHGLIWNWSGPAGFISSARQPLTTDSGQYRLIVTELRNGCSDTAFTTLVTLPLTWGVLQCEALPNGTLLRWSTLLESQTAYFSIQMDGGEGFREIGRINAAGNTYQRTDYSFTWSGGYKPQNRFRIVLINQNGSKEDGGICTPDKRQPYLTSKVSVFPNASDGRFSLQYDESLTLNRITVTDGMGRIVPAETRWLANGLQSINIKLPVTGFYYIVADFEGFRYSAPLLVK